jgi:hypothetical protein
MMHIDPPKSHQNDLFEVFFGVGYQEKLARFLKTYMTDWQGLEIARNAQMFQVIDF